MIMWLSFLFLLSSLLLPSSFSYLFRQRWLWSVTWWRFEEMLGRKETVSGWSAIYIYIYIYAIYIYIRMIVSCQQELISRHVRRADRYLCDPLSSSSFISTFSSPLMCIFKAFSWETDEVLNAVFVSNSEWKCMGREWKCMKSVWKVNYSLVTNWLSHPFQMILFPDLFFGTESHAQIVTINPDCDSPQLSFSTLVICPDSW